MEGKYLEISTYKQHKEKIRKIRKNKTTCDCGVQVTKPHLERHKQSQYHKDFMDKKTIF